MVSPTWIPIQVGISDLAFIRHLSFNLDNSLEKDLGLDSLARVELLARIERHFGLVLPERIFTEAETPRDLLRERVGVQPAQHQAAVR